MKAENEFFKAEILEPQACILSVVLVPIYWHLTPGHCWCWGVEKPPSHQGDSLSSSMLSTTSNHDPTAGGDKDDGFDWRVAFLEQGLSSNLKLGWLSSELLRSTCLPNLTPPLPTLGRI